MRRAGLVVAEALERMTEAVRPGVTTGALDAARPRRRWTARRDLELPRLRPPAVPGGDLRVGRRRGRARHPGRPGAREGELCSIDFGAVVDGWHGDAAVTVPVGQLPPELPGLNGSPSEPVGGAGGRPAGRPALRRRRRGGGRRAAARVRARSRTTPGTGSARAMHEPPGAEHGRPGRGQGMRSRRGSSWRSSRWSRSAAADTRAARRRLDRRHRGRQAGRALGAHRGRHAGRPVGAHGARRRDAAASSGCRPGDRTVVRLVPYCQAVAVERSPRPGGGARARPRRAGGGGQARGRGSDAGAAEPRRPRR